MSHNWKTSIEIAAALALTMALALGRVAFTETRDGRDIVADSEARHKLADETLTIDMRLKNGRGGERERKARIWSMENRDGLEKMMLVFLEPADIKGTGLLTWEQEDREDDQWLYLPASRRERRIAAGGKRDRFMGTEFAYEDLQSENLALYDYRLAGEETFRGQTCYLVEATPRDEESARASGYSLRKLWIRKDILFTVKVEYFDKRGRPAKELENSEPKPIEGDVWRSDVAEMKNLVNGRATEMIVLDRAYNQGLSEDDFTLRKLTSF